MLGKKTATALGILKIVDVNSVKYGTIGISEVVSKYSACFHGLVKLKNFQLKIPLDNTIEPVVSL